MDYHAIANCLEQDFYGERRAFHNPSDKNFQDWAVRCLAVNDEINRTTSWASLHHLQLEAGIKNYLRSSAFGDYNSRLNTVSAQEVRKLLTYISENKKVFTIEEFL